MGVLEQAEAEYANACIRLVPEFDAKEFESRVKYPQMFAAAARMSRLYAARM